MRLITKKEAEMLREKGFGSKVFSTHTKHKKYYVEERTKAENIVFKYRNQITVK